LNRAPYHCFQATLCILLAFCCSRAFGTISDRSFFQLSHTAWTEANGAPGETLDIAQSTDGYLWVVTTAGLLRFDGVRFEPLESFLPGAALSPYVSHMWAPPSGGLWIAYKFGGVGFLKGSSLTNYKPGNGLPSGGVRSFQEDRDHVIWATSTRGVANFDGHQWRTLGAESGLAGLFVSKFFIDRSGSIWITTADSVWRRRAGATLFEDTGIRGKLPMVMESPDGSLLLLDPLVGVRKLEHVNDARPQLGAVVVDFPVGFLVYDRAGGIWAGGGESIGALRIRKPSRDGDWSSAPGYAERFDTTNGLSGRNVTCALEDQEGNIWIGTNAGLDRFHEVPFVKVPVPPSVSWFSVLATNDGRMWTAGHEDSWLAVDGEAVKLPTTPTQFLISALFAGSNGSIWLGNRDGLWQLVGTQWSHLAPPPELGPDFKPTHVIAADRSGNLWVSFLRGGVYRFADGAWTLNGNQEAMLKETAITIAGDLKQSLWFGYTDNRASFLSDDTLRNYSAKDGISVGSVVAIASRQHTWIGGDHGLMNFDGTRFSPVVPARGARLSAVSGIIELESGEVWLNTGVGVVRIPAPEIRKYLADPTYAVDFETFSYQDGISGRTDGITNPTIAQGADGRLWFATTSGISWVDPKRILRNQTPPPVWLQAVTANGAQVASAGPVSLPPGTRTLQVDYTALSLSIPERVQFRYRLEGQDSDWTNAGNRRTAFFTNLRPGQYHFRVIASNNDGLWNNVGDSIDLTIAPRFFQTRWFLALCCAVGAALLWAVYRLRLRQVRLQLGARLEERLAERERIARDLHDTLLQSMQGLMFRFQGVADRLPPLNPVRKAMEDELGIADGVMIESRETITGLRGMNVSLSEFPEALRTYGETLEKEYSVKFVATVRGTRKPLHPVVFEEALLICREATANAFRHARATLIEIEIHYERSEFGVRVRDNGVGLDTTIRPTGASEGHFGLLGMRERAVSIRARIEISSQLGLGTEVSLKIPSTMAYRERHRSLA
jgi:signal transduction histidine kinase